MYYTAAFLLLAIDFVTENDCSCVAGFPKMPVFEVGRQTNNDSVLTMLIPDMSFIQNATIAGFIVAGRRLNRKPHSKIQIWRQNSSQPNVYYKVQSNMNADVVCVSLVEVVNDIRYCILNAMAVSVQPGDFLGLELPQTNETSEIYFTNGGPDNYVFRGALSSPVELVNESDFTVVQQQPQITFSLTSGIIKTAILVVILILICTL